MNPLGSNQGAIPFLNTYRVSILTNSDIRYEGTLYQVNPDKKNIVLTNVISFGTEGRSRTNEIMGSNVVHDSIVFEGKDIKDLNVIENNPPPPPATTNNNNNNDVQNQETTAPSNPPQDSQNAVEDNNNKTIHQNSEETAKQERKSSAVEEKDEKKNQNEFDFQEMNEKFHKLTLLESKNAEKGFGKYERTSFFDNISNSTTEKNKETREDRQHQNQIDKETFGSDLMQMRKGQKYKGNNYNTYNKPYYGKPQTYRNNNYSSHGYRNYDDNNYSYGYRNYEDSSYRTYNNEYNSRGGYGRGGAKGGYNNQSGYTGQVKYSKVYEEKKTKEGD